MDQPDKEINCRPGGEDRRRYTGEYRLRTHQRDLPEDLTIVPLVDPLVEAEGFHPRSFYIETCWLPIMRPTATLAYRRLGMWAINEPNGLTVGTRDLAAGLGLGEGIGWNTAIARTLARLVNYQAAGWRRDGRLAVRRALGPVPEIHTGQLSASASLEHRRLTGGLAHIANGTVGVFPVGATRELLGAAADAPSRPNVHGVPGGHRDELTKS